MEIFAGLVIGFFGSFHCIGMCGPIALALPVPQSGNFKFFAGRIIYNLGRVLSYALMGFFFGFIGERLIISGFQQTLSIFLGIFILIMVFIPQRFRNQLLAVNLILKVITPVKTAIGIVIQTKKLLFLFKYRFFKWVLTMRICICRIGWSNFNRECCQWNDVYDFLRARNSSCNVFNFCIQQIY